MIVPGRPLVTVGLLSLVAACTFRPGVIDCEPGDTCVAPPIDALADPDTNGAIDALPASPFCDAAGEPALVACWEFEGTVNDASGDDNHGIALNTTFAQDGKTGLALQMAAGSSVAIPDSDSLTPAQLTIEGWVNPSVLPTTGLRMGIFDNDGQYGAFIFPSQVQCSTSVVFSADFTMPLDTWTHVACTYDGTTGRLYLNGVEAATLGGGSALGAGNTVGARIGSNSPSGNELVGRIDQLRVWNVARTAPQICQAAGLTPCS